MSTSNDEAFWLTTSWLDEQKQYNEAPFDVYEIADDYTSLEDVQEDLPPEPSEELLLYLSCKAEVKDHLGALSNDQKRGDQVLWDKDIRIRELPKWSSPLPDFATTEVSFKFKTDDEYLEFLSLFLSVDRQVDIGFSKRHALICFLMKRLEESHYQYCRQSMPEEFEILQLESADVFELQVWRALLRAYHVYPEASDYAFDEDRRRCDFAEDLDYLRQLAVHRASTFRYTFHSSTIRSAAACAYNLSDNELLEQIDLIVKVLYADAGGESRLAVTKEQRKTVSDLLWPPKCPIETSTQLLNEVQNLAERSSHNFCQRRLPNEFAAFRPAAAEHFELNWWRDIFWRQQFSRVGDSPGRRPCAEEEVHTKLEDCWVVHLRNAAAHRDFGYLRTDDQWVRKLTCLVDLGLNYVRILEDEETAGQIENLKAEAIPLLFQKRKQWVGLSWCQARDPHLRKDQTLERAQYWGDKEEEYFKKNIDIRPLKSWYLNLHSRIFDVLVERGDIQIYRPPETPDAAAPPNEEIPEAEPVSESPKTDAPLTAADCYLALANSHKCSEDQSYASEYEDSQSIQSPTAEERQPGLGPPRTGNKDPSKDDDSSLNEEDTQSFHSLNECGDVVSFDTPKTEHLEVIYGSPTTDERIKGHC
ncbi:MAG: hypothetical protein Q9181_002502 [Wetmoreana brouardii]